jgi:hypothetical protein
VTCARHAETHGVTVRYGASLSSLTLCQTSVGDVTRVPRAGGASTVEVVTSCVSVCTARVRSEPVTSSVSRRISPIKRARRAGGRPCRAPPARPSASLAMYRTPPRVAAAGVVRVHVTLVSE